MTVRLQKSVSFLKTKTGSKKVIFQMPQNKPGQAWEWDKKTGIPGQMASCPQDPREIGTH